MAAALDAVDVAALCDDELVEVMAAWRRVTSWAQARELAAVAELARRREEQHQSAPAVKVGEFIADEIALELRLSGGAAGMWAGLACKLADQLQLTRQALEEGRIDLARARVIADGLLGVDLETAALVEAAVIGEAQRISAGRLRHHLREAIKAVDPQAAEQRRQRARKVRSLEKWATAAGTCELAFREMSEEDAEAIYNRINAVAQAMRADGDVRPIDAIRHDLGVALLRGTPLPEAARDLRHNEDGENVDRPNAIRANTPTDREGPQGPAGSTGPDDDSGLRAPARPRTSGPTPTSETQERGKTDRYDGAHGRYKPAEQRETQDHGETAGHGETAWHGEDAGHGEADRSGGDRGHTVADAAAQITDSLAKVIDERLTSVAGRHRTAGRRTGLALRVAAAMQTMSSALAELKERWCQTTTGQVCADLRTGVHGHDGYRPTAGMRRLIERTHQVCAFPTCDRPAPRCDLDHTIAWHQGGPTCPCNMSPLCRRHHRLKQHPQWRLFQPWPGLLVWVTPAGKWHTVIPENRQ
ncbi:MAG: endonuclease [Actinomycetia bacterium]|nr:endonuclease [Actinomycetes bacterium]